MGSRKVLYGNRDAVLALAAVVDKAAGCPIVGRNAATGKPMPDAQGTVTMGEVLAHPTDPSLAAYGVADCNRELVAAAGAELAKVGHDLAKDLSGEEALAEEWKPPPPARRSKGK